MAEVPTTPKEVEERVNVLTRLQRTIPLATEGGHKTYNGEEVVGKETSDDDQERAAQLKQALELLAQEIPNLSESVRGALETVIGHIRDEQELAEAMDKQRRNALL